MPIDEATFKFVTGSINRERQRIAKHLIKAGVNDSVVRGILDCSEDVNVFRDNGTAVTLDDPISAEDLPTGV